MEHDPNSTFLKANDVTWTLNVSRVYAYPAHSAAIFAPCESLQPGAASHKTIIAALAPHLNDLKRVAVVLLQIFPRSLWMDLIAARRPRRGIGWVGCSVVYLAKENRVTSPAGSAFTFSFGDDLGIYKMILVIGYS